MKIGHTPGPWILKEDGEANHWAISDRNGWLISFLHNGEAMSEKQKANARLIASAPELLSALVEANEQLNSLTGYSCFAAEQAIKKARGEHE